MKRLKKIVRLSVTHLLIIAMLMTPMSPIFAITNEKKDAADLVASSATVEVEENESVSAFINPEWICTGAWDSGYRDWLCSAPSEVLMGTTSELLEYFLESNFLGQHIFSVAPTSRVTKVDFTINEAFKELISRDDFIKTLEDYAKDVLNGTRSDVFAERKLEKILEQDSVKNVFFATADSSLNCPVIASLYSNDSE